LSTFKHLRKDVAQLHQTSDLVFGRRLRRLRI
jgi:hypothetical protein